jgi:hypothetical protein
MEPDRHLAFTILTPFLQQDQSSVKNVCESQQRLGGTRKSMRQEGVILCPYIAWCIWAIPATGMMAVGTKSSVFLGHEFDPGMLILELQPRST